MFGTIRSILDGFLEYFGIREFEPIDNHCNKPLSKVQKSGIITDLRDDFGVIDSNILFRTKLLHYGFNVGDKVSYSYIIEDGFGEDLKLLSCGSEVRPKFQNSFIATIMEREGKIFVTDPGEYKFDLDLVHIEFLPYRGDWVQLIFKEEDINKKCEIDKVLPLRTKMFMGSVTKFEDDFGIINGHIYFTIYNCNPGYRPHKDDKVICSAIESNQGYCDWRALSVCETSSKHLPKKYTKPVLYHGTPKRIPEPDNIQTVCPDLITLNLGEELIFKACIKNNSSSDLELIKITIHPEGIIKQASVIKQEVLKLGTETQFEFKIVASHIGFSAFNLCWRFKNFDLNKIVRIEVVLNCHLDWKHKVSQGQYEKNVSKTGNIMSLSDKIVLPGDRNFKPYAFVPVMLGKYSVPEDLIQLYSEIKNKNVMDQMIELQKMLPCLEFLLDDRNYKVKFHTILFLEEISNLDKVAKLEIEVQFTKLNDYLVAKLPDNDSVHLLGQGDKVFADLPWGTDSEKDFVYEGYIKQINEVHIVIGFHEEFRKYYKEGKFYRIRFETSRTSYRRRHQAIDLCVKNLGYEWLFPTKIRFKKSQVIIKGERSNALKEDINKYFNQFYEIDLKKIDHPNKYKRGMNTGPSIDISVSAVVNWLNPALNEEQKRCIISVLEGVARPLPYIIFGPPGTGKTFTLVELIMQIVFLVPGSRLLITAPSNSAVDIITSSLINTGLRKSSLIRLVSHRYASQGRLPLSLVDVSAIPTYDPNLNDIVNGYGIKTMSKNLLGRNQITLGTLNLVGMLYNMGFTKGHFTHIIVDEAGQATEPETLIPVGFLNSNCGQLVLAGDPMQLGPVVMSDIASRYGLTESFLKRMFSRFPYSQDPEQLGETSGYNPQLVTKLKQNYRALPSIMSIYNTLFYNNDLISKVLDSEGPEWDTLISAQEVFTNEEKVLYPIKFYGIIGLEEREQGHTSYFNKYEVMQVTTYLKRLYKLGIKPEQIGVVTPYNAQVKKIIQLCSEFNMELPKIGSVEEFQGQERDFIIISTVRTTNELKSLEFLSNHHRFNVSISRAKTGLIVIGNPYVLIFIKEWHFLISTCILNRSYEGCEIPKELL